MEVLLKIFDFILHTLIKSQAWKLFTYDWSFLCIPKQAQLDVIQKVAMVNILVHKYEHNKYPLQNQWHRKQEFQGKKMACLLQ